MNRKEHLRYAAFKNLGEFLLTRYDAEERDDPNVSQDDLDTEYGEFLAAVAEVVPILAQYKTVKDLQTAWPEKLAELLERAES